MQLVGAKLSVQPLFDVRSPNWNARAIWPFPGPRPLSKNCPECPGHDFDTEIVARLAKEQLPALRKHLRIAETLSRTETRQGDQWGDQSGRAIRSEAKILRHDPNNNQREPCDAQEKH